MMKSGSPIRSILTWIEARNIQPAKRLWLVPVVAAPFVALLLSSALVVASNGRTIACDPSTGHCYEYVADPMNWDTARATAEAMEYQGVFGHLATMTSQAETDFIAANLPDAVFFHPPFDGGAYIGAFRHPDSAHPADGWQWVTGEPWDYTNWAGGEPNNSGNEDVLNFWSTAGHWNDVNRTLLKGFLVEYPAPPPPVACGAGTYSSTGNEPCTDAPMGSFVSTEGATSATLCPVGTFSSVTGAESCTPAPAGSYVNTTGATGSLLCPAGTYAASTGSSSCTPADAGFFVPTIGATSQTACPVHYWSDGGATECYPLDSDGDGVYDKDDAYLNSDMSPTVRTGTCVTTVVNQVLPSGATFNDLIATARAGARNHGQFVSAVTQLAGAWQKAGLISGRDHGMITSCAARSK